MTGLHIARERVHKGIKWAGSRAPTGWRQHMFRISFPKVGGPSAHYRGRDCYPNECPLALMFTGRTDLVADDGRIHFANVANHYNLSSAETIEMGFMSDSLVSSDELDAAWGEALCTYAQPTYDGIHGSKVAA